MRRLDGLLTCMLPARVVTQGVVALLSVLKPALGGIFAVGFLGTAAMVSTGEAAAARQKRS